MKLYAMSDLLQNLDSRYLLVNALAHRAREIAVQAEVDGISLEEKPVTMAMDEAEAGNLRIASLEAAASAEEETPEEEEAPAQIPEAAEEAE